MDRTPNKRRGEELSQQDNRRPPPQVLWGREVYGTGNFWGVDDGSGGPPSGRAGYNSNETYQQHHGDRRGRAGHELARYDNPYHYNKSTSSRNGGEEESCHNNTQHHGDRRGHAGHEPARYENPYHYNKNTSSHNGGEEESCHNNTPSDYYGDGKRDNDMKLFFAENKRKQIQARQAHQAPEGTPEENRQLRQDAVEKLTLWLKAEWRKVDDDRIKEGLASQDDDVQDDVSYDSNPEPDFADVVTPKFDPKPLDLPPHYLPFVEKLPECSLPLQKQSGHLKCFCPLSRKLEPWRVQNNLSVDERYIPFCNNMSPKSDSPLSDHLTCSETDDDGIDWHRIVSKYLELLRQGCIEKGLVH
jgi:hypothetical protein